MQVPGRPSHLGGGQEPGQSVDGGVLVVEAAGKVARGGGQACWSHTAQAQPHPLAGRRRSPWPRPDPDPKRCPSPCSHHAWSRAVHGAQ